MTQKIERENLTQTTVLVAQRENSIDSTDDVAGTADQTFQNFFKGIRDQQAWIHDEDSPIVVDDLDDADIANSNSMTSLERKRWNQFRGRNFHTNKHKCCPSCKYRP